ncbi:helix-turn-helix domain-containing protein [Paenibacillus chartarius]|uniref:Helix-turn-helix domain-containing protein n=1 Tax=Paenibacillus chartarius TaxID=747481 RepID=A0ABV6DU61_9BACL
MPRGKYNALEKLAVIQEVSSDKIGFLAAAKKYGINKTTLMKWQRRYKLYGEDGLVSQERKSIMSASSARLLLTDHERISVDCCM